MRKEVLSNGLVALKSIKDEILKSKLEILIGSTRFINEELFPLLLNKSREGVRVKIIADNHIWIKQFTKAELPDNFLVSIKKDTESTGVNRDFCVVDQKIAISASTNWTYYTQNGDNENLQITDDIDIVKAFIENFDQAFSNIMILDNQKKNSRGLFGWLKRIFKRIDAPELPTEETQKPTIQEERFDNVFNISNTDEVLNSIVNSPVEEFDREELRRLGEESANRVNGNFNILTSVMNSLYTAFVNSLNVTEKEKHDLKTKIDLKYQELINIALTTSNKKIAIKNQEKMAKEKEYEIELSGLEKGEKETNLSIDNIEKNEIPKTEKEIEKIEKEKLELDVKHITKPEVNKYEIIQYLVLPLGLLIVIVLFYSSSAYLLIYASVDYENSGIVPKIYNSNFYIQALNRRGSALFYVLFFNMIPFGLSWAAEYLEETKARVFAWIGIILLDTFIAFKIKNTIAVIQRQEFGVTSPIGFEWILEFLLLFFLGFVPLLVFTLSIRKLRDYMRSLKVSDEEEKVKIKKNQLINDILLLEGELVNFEQEIIALKKRIIEIEDEKKEVEINSNYLTPEYDKEIQAIEKERDEYFQYVKNKVDVYKNGIDNNTIYIPAVALNDRINVFLEGWNTWLFNEFSNAKAGELAYHAQEITNSWLAENIDLPEAKNLKVITR